MQNISARKKVYGLLLVLAVVTALAVVGVQQFGNPVEADNDADASKTTEKEEIIPVQLAEVSQGEISSYLATSANLRAVREVDVVNRTDGIIERVLVEEGDGVDNGQLLAKLDDTKLLIQLESAQKRLAQARLQLETATIRKEKAQSQIHNTQDELDRYQKLFKENLVSEREVAQQRYRLDELQHDERISASEGRELALKIEELQAEVDQLKLEISRTEIRAPFAGHITKRMTEVGQTVRALDALFKLGDFTPLEADVFLSEREALAINPGQPAWIRLGVDSESRVAGRVGRVAPVVDQATGTVKVTVELREGQGGFKPGAFVRVEIKTDTRRQALLIPKKALVEEDGNPFVFIARDETATRVPVEVGYSSEGQIEVRSGIQLGDRIVVAGQGALKEGSKIKVVS